MTSRTIDKVISPQSALRDAMQQTAQQTADSKALILPCRIVAQAGWLVSVSVLVETNKPIPIIEGVPVMSPAAIYWPMAAGDIGLLIPADVFLNLAMESGSPVDASISPGNLSGYTFLPLPKAGQVPVNPAAVCIGGATDTVDITSGGRTVDMTVLWTYLTGFQAAYNANMTALGKPTYPGVF